MYIFRQPLDLIWCRIKSADTQAGNNTLLVHALSSMVGARFSEVNGVGFLRLPEIWCLSHPQMPCHDVYPAF